MNPTCLFRQYRKLFSVLLALFYVPAGELVFAQSGSDPGFLQRHHPSDVRVMSWNVRLGSVIPPEGARHQSFARIVRAMDPDVIVLQEMMRPEESEKLKPLMDNITPLSDGRSWQIHGVADNVLLSRFPLRQPDGELVFRYPYPRLGLPDFHYGYATALVDIPDDYSNADLYVIAMHNKSGAGEEHVELRQQQSDSIVRWMRNLRDSSRETTIDKNTPVVILGDMNVVRDASTQPFETLLVGDIVDEAAFGSDFVMDWDGTALTDARPSHNGKGEDFYTWRYDEMPFEPGALDRVIYTDSVLLVHQSFVLNTTIMSVDELTGLNLQESDVLYGGQPGFYDHLPLIVDFSFTSAPDTGGR